MTTNNEPGTDLVKKIVIRRNGPYVVHGGVPLVRKTQIVSEHGEPLTWEKGETLETSGTYRLCRCGQSSNKPFCDGSHSSANFDGTETADTGTLVERQVILAGGTKIVVKRDHSLCVHSGFCGNELTNIADMVHNTDDTRVRAQVIAMIERCPSGATTYSIEEEGADIEPDLPQQIALTTEITGDGPIRGPLWVTGNISVERADGQPLETRNRIALCRCGFSKNKPFCDGTHREMGITGN